MSPLLILGITLVLLVILVRLRLELGLAMLASAVALGLLGRLRPMTLLRTMGSAWWNATTFALAATLISILLLENIMRKRGYLYKVLASLRSLVADRRVVMALCPAFLGLLPSAGGAVFSAPMVEDAGAGLPLSPEDKSVINYWYRHIWECSFPLYPGIILAAKIFEIPVSRLVWHQFPFTILAILLGGVVALKRLGKEATPARVPLPAAAKWRATRHLMVGVAPVLIVIVAVLGFGLEAWVAVLGMVLALVVLHRYRPRQIVDLVRESLSMRPILLVAGIMAFRHMLDAAGLVEALPGILTGLGFPPTALVVLLPLTLGMLIGLGQGFVGASFPLLLGIIGTGARADLGLAALAYVSGFTGLMLTPLHLCLVLTVQFFRANLWRVWRRLAPAMVLTLLLAIPYGLWLA